jgi:serine/threonine-protein kinase
MEQQRQSNRPERRDSTVSYESQRPPPAPKAPDDALAKTVAETRSGELALDVTIAAPLPNAEGSLGDVVGAATLSVLPKIDAEGETIKLVRPGGPRYRPLRPLGEGGMGEVSLVEDQDIGRTVAIKRLRGEAQAAPQIARFVDEVRTIGSLEHPNIVPIHDVGVDDAGRFFFVMKYVDGETVESIIERLGAGDPRTIAEYPVSRRLEIFVGLLRALHYAHSRGVIHRDVKPANVMVGRFGEVILMDWGVARPIGGAKEPAGRMSASDMRAAPSRASETHDGALIGTPLYMSPEQALGKNAELDARSDLYSACVVLHELLALRHLREGTKSLAELVALAATDDVASTRELGIRPHASNPNGFPPELMHFIVRGLRRLPRDRWQSADQMLAELEAIQEGRCRVQCTKTMTKRMAREAGRFVDRSPGLATYGFVLGVIVVVALLANAIRDLVAGL